MTTLSLRDSKPSKINVINYSNVYKPNTKTIPSNYGKDSYPKDAHEEKGSGIVTDARYDVTMHINLSCSWDSISPPLDEMTRKKYEIHDLLRVVSINGPFKAVLNVPQSLFNIYDCFI